MSEDFSSVVEFEIYYVSQDSVKSGLPIRGVWRLKMFSKEENDEYIVSSSVDVRVLELLKKCIMNNDKKPLEKLFNLWCEKCDESRNDLSRKGHDDYLYASIIIKETKEAIQKYKWAVEKIKDIIEEKEDEEAKKALQDDFTKI